MGDLSQNISITKYRTSTIQNSYNLTRSKVSHVDYLANSLKIDLTNTNKYTYSIEFQVSNYAVAYRYVMPMNKDTACCIIKHENSGFNFPSYTKTFLCPQSVPMSGWHRSKPSYEEEYILEDNLNSKSKYGYGYTFPCLFKIRNNGWVLISETGNRGHYPGSHLSEYNNEYKIAFPDEKENNGFGSANASITLPGTTPWRTITLGKTLKPIVETTVQFDVVKPLYEASQQYIPGASSWSWIVWQDSSMDMSDQKKFIDLSHEMGWKYILVDALWETQIGRKKILELFKYAHDRNVDIFLWYNSNGNQNDAPQDAKQRMYDCILRKAEMKWLQENGIKGIKVDFFGGDKQETMRLYEEILSDANDYGLQVIFHGCTLPRGWEKMFPNYVASEAVLASENLVFNQYFDDNEASNACLHPFIRNTVGSMDWGGTFLNRRLSRDNKSGNYRRTGDIFELATAIINQSSIQNFAITPINLIQKPKFEIDFMKTVPTTWDEVKLIDGYPGKFIIIARRHANQWYIAALNGEKKELNRNIKIPMFANQKVTIYTDVSINKSILINKQINNKGYIHLSLPSQGGIIITK